MEACAVLHNFLLEEGDNWADGDHHTEEATPLRLGLSFTGTQQAFNAGADFRNGLMAPVLAAGRSPYGILTYEQQRQQQREELEEQERLQQQQQRQD